MLSTCSTIGCYEAASATIEGPGGRIAVCFAHEMEALDRYGWSDLRPRAISDWDSTIAEAVALLRSPA